MNKKTYSYILVGVVVAVACGILLFHSGNSFEISKSGALLGLTKNTNLGPITGTDCSNANNRPIAVMISSDPEARPLSAIGQADIVFEMPVTPNGVTRMMSVFQCEQPKEFGSVRSSRLDFVPLALGLNVIYAHFGGEHTVLAELNSGIMDNIDGLKFDGTIYYRKTNIPRPHNAFTSTSLIEKAIQQLGYTRNGVVNGYQHESNSKMLEQTTPPAFYQQQFRVTWKYDQSSNSYLRSRDNRPEIDKNTGKQVSVQNVVEMQTSWSAWPPTSETGGKLDPNYVRIKTVGSGQAIFYKDGQIIKGTWEKSADKAKLYFYDESHKEIKFAPGKIWVEIIAQL